MDAQLGQAHLTHASAPQGRQGVDDVGGGGAGESARQTAVGEEDDVVGLA